MLRMQFPVVALAFTVMVGAAGASWAQEASILPANNTSFVQEIEPLRTYAQGDLKWSRSIELDGTIYLADRKKTVDGGKTIIEHDGPDLTELLKGALVISRPGLFYAVDGPTPFYETGVHRTRAWRSTDGLKTVHEETADFHVPNGPNRPNAPRDDCGMFAYRTILQAPDGIWLTTMEGFLTSDTIVPTDHQSKKEIAFKGRTMLVSSKDEGHTWDVVSTVAYPRPDDPVGEGFVEPALVQLADGRLLCVMRTGHHFPLYSCWSSDQGKTWTRPLYTGLERGCDPCLLRLRDGRILLTYGKRFPEGWSHAGPNDDFERFEKEYPAGSQLKMAISEDGSGSTWQDVTIARHMGTCYSCIFEVEPNVIFCQVDGWCFRIHLRPKQG